MKKAFLFSVLVCFHTILEAQKIYFIYLQSETATPFYVKMAGKIQSSTPEGYLILPKLTDSTYLITIGQPGKADEPRFSITINKADRGFLIKNIDGTTSLFDLQTLIVYKPITVESATTQNVIKNDNFTRMLAKAVDDSTLLSHPVVIQQEKPKPKEAKTEVAAAKTGVAMVENTVASIENAVTSNNSASAKPDTIQQTSGIVSSSNNTSVAPPIVQADAGIKNEPAVAAEPVKETVINKKEETSEPVKETIISKKEESRDPVQEENTRSIITRKPGSYTPEGLGFIFFDSYDGIIDTIKLVIPNQSIRISNTPQKQPAETRQFLEISDKAEDQSKQETTIAGQTSKTKLKAQCATLSTDDDFFKLRKEMVARNNDEEMINLAKKHFKGKCFRTEQIKYLSSLFLTDESKYQFFDAAYMHVSDQERFASLQREIKDAYYLNRFNALIGN